MSPSASPSSGRGSSSDFADLADAYDRDGVVRVPGLLSADWVARLLAAIDDVRVRQRTGEPFQQVECFTAPGRLTIRWMWREYEAVRAFFTASGVQDVVAAVLRTPTLRYWFDLTFIHEHGDDSAGSPWHHDIAAFPFTGEQIPSLWIALTDMDFDQAPLQCLRGTHRNSLRFRPPVYVDPDKPMPAGFAEMPDIEAGIAAGRYEVLQWPMKAGDALIIHPNTIHGAPPVTRSGDQRIAFTARWAGEDVRWAPTQFSMSLPGVDYATVPLGAPPTGPLFPEIALTVAGR